MATNSSGRPRVIVRKLTSPCLPSSPQYGNWSGIIADNVLLDHNSQPITDPLGAYVTETEA